MLTFIATLQVATGREQEFERLQIELSLLLDWVREAGARVAVVFEGRDAAGKGGAIKRIQERPAGHPQGGAGKLEGVMASVKRP